MHNRQRFFVILGNFLHFDPPDNLKNQNLKKWKKTPGDIIILNLCTTDDNHMMYGSWDIEHNRHNFFSFWAIFCPFLSIFCPNSLKNQNKKNEQNAWRYHHFIQVSQKSWSYTILFLRYGCMTDVIVIFQFGLLFTLLHPAPPPPLPFPPPSPSPLTAQKKKKITKRTKHLEISSFYTHVPKIMIRWCMIHEIWCTINGRTDGQIDGTSDI